jgi:hypothetical protein
LVLSRVGQAAECPIRRFKGEGRRRRRRRRRSRSDRQTVLRMIDSARLHDVVDTTGTTDLRSAGT